ncbi:unnamed protein product [Kluyveromyces dobzhanskii CBS 2104]|uniref:WGS project CCBQ000000000 data, contig 00107 n=1 Tax=Kluyveromyces dobzhanskii CBS 2104 TaxID=1427455 RepID=A0A0A8KYW1_9SACH|nr:unnamed protein product [Kluyveromyces dobzhanskii CBS 2104]
MAQEGAEKKIHLVVLVHGLWGNRSHMNEISNYLLSLNNSCSGSGKSSGETIVVHQTHLNEGYKTYDGIDVGGIRVAKEIESQIGQWGSDCVVKFSLIGYSLGGLICRYALGVLYQEQTFKKNDIELINFVTFCTPHVGALAPGNNVAVNLFNTIVPLVLGNSGKQMFLKDKYNGYPLLYVMSLPNSVFYKALKQFRYRSLYANIINDKRTAWWTSGISKNDPFNDVNERNGTGRFQFVQGYEPVVLDHESPLLITKFGEDSDVNSEELDEMKLENEIDLQDYYFLNYWFRKILLWIAVFINLIVIGPLWFIWFIISGIMETFKSTVRATAFAKKYSTYFITEVLDISTDMIDSNDDDEFSITSSTLFEPTTSNYEHQIEQSLLDQRDNLIESLFDAIERKETRTATVENINDTDGIDQNDTKINVTIKELESHSVEELISIKKPKIANGANEDDDELFNLLSNFNLNISKKQLDIIESLNKLTWSKFPIYIRKTPSTHAASIIRHPDPNFDEGHTVLKHFVDHGFQIA